MKLLPVKFILFLLLVNISGLIYGQNLTRGPYLQMGNQTSITIRWRTSIACNSKVEFGTEYGTYISEVTHHSNVTEHIVTITGLNPDTKYYYRIGTTSAILQEGRDNFFTTVPPSTTKRKVRIAAFGDCGRSNAVFQDENLANYRNYLNTNGIDAPDAWILLGDNAYSQGTDDQYSQKFFGIYGDNILKNHKLYPAPGNHDYGNNQSLRNSRTIPYFQNFSMPMNGECGGLASGKPNFYSFDIGDVHFLSLDSWGIEADESEMGTQGNSLIKSWVINDLELNKKKWVIAYWHHPPYTKGSHNSDTESELIKIRNNFINELEIRGVDMIICGHSHNYERGYLMKGFRGNWTSFDPQVHAVSTSSAKYNSSSSCAYSYNSAPLNHGTVYVVAGSAGASGTMKSNFGAYAMPYAVNDGGIFYFEVEDNRLDAKMLRRNGTIFDQFTIMKDVNNLQRKTLLNNQPVTLTASWPSSGNYIWSTGATSRSITVTPPAFSRTSYYVKDEFGCMTDSFVLNTLAVLPVELSSFRATLNGEQVNLDWTTTSEAGSAYFRIERSIDGVHFEGISRVNAAGNSSSTKNYSYQDHRPLRGITYYRLAQVDIDGSFRYSDVKKVNNPRGKTLQARVLKNGNLVNLSIHSTQSDLINLYVYDIAGRTVETRTFRINQGLTQFPLHLPKGHLVLKFVSKTYPAFTERILIE